MILASILLAAQAASPQPAPALSTNLQPLAFLVGSCWRGTFPDGRRTDTHCFTAFYGGAFVRDHHVVGGAPQPYEGETFYRWDAAARQIRYDYYASDGMHTSGSATPTVTGLGFPEETAQGPNGTMMTIRSAWARDGDNAYISRAEMRQGESWREMWHMRLERVGPAPAR